MEMQPTIDEVYEAVRESRHRGPDALAALALRYGADAVGWMIRHAALRRELLDAERGMDEAREERDTLRRDLDAARAEIKAARESAAEVWRLRESVAALRADRARAVAGHDESVAAHDHTRAQWATACRERDEAREGHRIAAKMAADAVAERDAALARVEEIADERDAALARPRLGRPTPEERSAHIDAGGEWVMVWRQPDGEWRCYSTSEHSNTVADAHYIPARNGLPCAWPVPAVEVTP